jgi:DNA-binding MarR family transcriptional regulator
MENAEIARKLLGSFQRFRRVMKGPPHFADLKGSEMGLLFIIRHGCGAETCGMKVSELSSRLHVTSPSVTQLVTSLEEQGLVQRRMDMGDRRSVLVSLTEKGRGITEKAEDHLLAMLSGLVEHLGPEKSLMLTEILEDVFDYFAILSDKGVD